MRINLPSLGRISVAAALATMTVLSACKKSSDSGPSTLTIDAVQSGSTSLFGSAAATNVSTSDNIVVTFDQAVDAATATAANFALTDQFNATVATTVTSTDDAVTINPTSDLTQGTLYTLVIGTGAKGSNGSTLAAAQTITFTTLGPKNIVPPQVGAQLTYFGLNGRLGASAGSAPMNPSDSVAITWGPDRAGNANSAAMFNGTTSIVEFANGLDWATPSQTISYWVKFDTTGISHNHMVMGGNFFFGSEFEFFGDMSNFKHAGSFARNGNTTVKDSLIQQDCYSGEALGDRNGATILGTPPAAGYKATLINKWAHIVYTYDAASKIRAIYVNGQPVVKHDYTRATDKWKFVTGQYPVTPAMDPTLSRGFAFGFAKTRSATFWDDTDYGNYNKTSANHFKGLLDDVRFYNVALSDAEVNSLWSAEK